MTLTARPRSASATTAAVPVVSTVIACGARDRGDDGAAPAAVAALDPVSLRGVRVRIVSQLTVEELTDAAALGRVVIADTAVGLPPGAVAVVPFARLAAASREVHVRSSHELPIVDVIGLVEMLLGRPLDGVVVAVGAANVAHGAGLSEPVRAALPRFGFAIVRAATGAAA